MQDATTHNLIIREWLNGSLFPLSGNLAFILLVFLAYSFIYRDNASWWKMPGVPTGCALFWIFTMETIRAGWIWWLLRSANRGEAVTFAVREYSNFSFIIAGAVLVAAFLRCTYLWSPPQWRHFFWIYSAISTVLFLAFSHYYPVIGNN
jgi:hypothetical protein